MSWVHSSRAELAGGNFIAIVHSRVLSIGGPQATQAAHDRMLVFAMMARAHVGAREIICEQLA